MALKRSGALRLSEIESEFDLEDRSTNIGIIALSEKADLAPPHRFSEFYGLSSGPREYFTSVTVTPSQKTHTIQWTVARDDGGDPEGKVYVYGRIGDTVPILREYLLNPDGEGFDLGITSFKHDGGYNNEITYRLAIENEQGEVLSTPQFVRPQLTLPKFDSALRITRDPTGTGQEAKFRSVEIGFDPTDEYDYSTGYEVEVYYKINDNQSFQQIDATISRNNALNIDNAYRKTFQPTSSNDLTGWQNFVPESLDFDIYTRYTVLVYLHFAGEEVSIRGFVDLAGEKPSIPLLSYIPEEKAVTVNWTHDNKTLKYELFYHNSPDQVAVNGTKIHTSDITPPNNSLSPVHTDHVTQKRVELGHNGTGYFVLRSSTQFASIDSDNLYAETSITLPSFEADLIAKRDPNNRLTEEGAKTVQLTWNLDEDPAKGIDFSEGYDIEVYYKLNSNQNFAIADSTITQDNSINYDNPIVFTIPQGSNNSGVTSRTITSVEFDLFVRYTLLVYVKWLGQRAMKRVLIDITEETANEVTPVLTPTKNTIQFVWTHDNKSVRYEIYYSQVEEFTLAAATRIYKTSSEDAGGIVTSYTHNIGYNGSGYYKVVAYTNFSSKESATRYSETIPVQPEFETAVTVERGTTSEAEAKKVSVTFNLGNPELDYAEGYRVEAYYRQNQVQSANADTGLTKDNAFNTTDPVIYTVAPNTAKAQDQRSFPLTGLTFDLFTYYTILVVVKWTNKTIQRHVLIPYAGTTPTKPVLGAVSGNNTITLSWTHDQKTLKYELYKKGSPDNKLFTSDITSSNDHSKHTTSYVHSIGWNKQATYYLKAFTEFINKTSDDKSAATITKLPALDGNITVKRDPDNQGISGQTKVAVGWDLKDETGGPDYSEGYTAKIYYAKQTESFVNSSLTWETSDNANSPETFVASGTGVQTVILSKTFGLLERFTILMEIVWTGQKLAAPSRVFLDQAGNTPSAPLISVIPTSSKGLKVTWSHDNKATQYFLFWSKTESTDLISTGGPSVSTKTFSTMTQTFEHTISSLNYGDIYYFQVRATNSYGSAKSDVKSGAVQNPVLAFGSGTILERAASDMKGLRAVWVVNPTDLTGYTITVTLDGVDQPITTTSNAEIWLNKLEHDKSYTAKMTLSWKTLSVSTQATIPAYTPTTMPVPTITQSATDPKTFTFSVHSDYTVTKWEYMLSVYDVGGAADWTGKVWNILSSNPVTWSLFDFKLTAMRVRAKEGTYDSKPAGVSNYASKTVAIGKPDISSLEVTSSTNSAKAIRVDTSTTGQIKIYLKFGTTALSGSTRKISGWRIRQVVNSVVSDGTLASGSDPLSTEFHAYTHGSISNPLTQETKYDFVLEVYWYNDVDQHRDTKHFSATTTADYFIEFDPDKQATASFSSGDVERKYFLLHVKDVHSRKSGDTTTDFGQRLFYKVSYTTDGSTWKDLFDYKSLEIPTTSHGYGTREAGEQLFFVTCRDYFTKDVYGNGGAPLSYDYRFEYYIVHKASSSTSSPIGAPTNTHKLKVAEPENAVTFSTDLNFFMGVRKTTDGNHFKDKFEVILNYAAFGRSYATAFAKLKNLNISSFNLTYTAKYDNPKLATTDWGSNTRSFSITKSNGDWIKKNSDQTFTVDIDAALKDRATSTDDVKAWNIIGDGTPTNGETMVNPTISGQITFTDGPSTARGMSRTMNISGVGLAQPRYFPHETKSFFTYVGAGQVYETNGHRFPIYSAYKSHVWNKVGIRQLRTALYHSEFGSGGGNAIWVNWPFHIYRRTSAASNFRIYHYMGIEASNIRMAVLTSSTRGSQTTLAGSTDYTSYIKPVNVQGGGTATTYFDVQLPSAFTGYLLLEAKSKESLPIKTYVSTMDFTGGSGYTIFPTNMLRHWWAVYVDKTQYHYSENGYVIWTATSRGWSTDWQLYNGRGTNSGGILCKYFFGTNINFMDVETFVDHDSFKRSATVQRVVFP